MADDKIQIEIQAIDQFSKAFGEIDQNFAVLINQNQQMLEGMKRATPVIQKNTFSWTELRSAYSTVLDVVRKGQQIWSATVGELDRYAAQVERTSRLTGLSAEESSRLIQASDDLFISYESLNNALTIAAKKQTLSIDGIAKLSDQYVALGTAQEKSAFAAKTFGRNYGEVVKLLEVGGETIRKMAAETPEGLVLTDKDIDRMRAYRREMDAFQDSAEAMKLTVGGALVDAFNKFAISQRTDQILLEQMGITSKDITVQALALAKATDEQTQAARAQAEAEYYGGSAMDKARQSAEELQASIEELTAANTKYLDLVGSLTQSQDNLAESERKIQEDYAAGNITLEEAQAQWTALQEKQSEATRVMILNMLQQQLAIGGLTEAETTYLLDLGLKWGVYSQDAVDAAKAAQKEVRALTDQFNNLPTAKTITVTTVFNSVGGAVGTGSATSTGGGGKKFAEGGSFTIPQQFGYEGFSLGGIATASGGERVDITPASKASGGITVNILLDGASIDPEETARKIGPAVRRVLRDM